ncbi:MAG: DUF1292 domain-containing protein [Clostridia bacterium]|nr:DUF1292 domain-containing protein [Clostridia bacterium]
MFETEIVTLVDDETGKEVEFEVIATLEFQGNVYYALLPLEDNEKEEYVILKLEKDENGEDVLSTIDDDEEFDLVADAFDDAVFSEIDYDAE